MSANTETTTTANACGQQTARDLHETLNALHELYLHGRDAFERDNWDHRHLRAALLEAAEILHEQDRIDDVQFALICASLEEDKDVQI